MKKRLDNVKIVEQDAALRQEADEVFTIPQNSQCEMTPEELSKLIEKWEDERISMTKNITPR